MTVPDEHAPWGPAPTPCSPAPAAFGPGASGVAHLPSQPSWSCQACGRAWPCRPAQERLLAELGRVDLALLMWDHLEEAARDMPHTAVSYLFTRFLRWTS